MLHPHSVPLGTTLRLTCFCPTHLPLAQSTELKVGGTFSVNASVDEDDICYESDNVFIEVHDSDANPVERSYGDVVVTMVAGPDMADNISHDPIGTFHSFSSCLLPSLSLKHYNLSVIACHDMLEGNDIDCMDSLGTFRGYDPSLDPCSLYLGSMPTKILFTIASNHSTDFSTACDKFTRAPSIIS